MFVKTCIGYIIFLHTVVAASRNQLVAANSSCQVAAELRQQANHLADDEGNNHSKSRIGLWDPPLPNAHENGLYILIYIYIVLLTTY